jgi:hypothetical protein
MPYFKFRDFEFQQLKSGTNIAVRSKVLFSSQRYIFHLLEIAADGGLLNLPAGNR